MKLLEEKKEKLNKANWSHDQLSQFAIKGNEDEWSKALSSNPKGAVSVKM